MNSEEMLTVTQEAATVYIDYTNWKGERSVRAVVPCRLWFGATVYHRTPQWLMDARDVAKNELRTFALSSIHSWSLDMNPKDSPVIEQPQITLNILRAFVVLAFITVLGILLAKGAIKLWQIL